VRHKLIIRQNLKIDSGDNVFLSGAIFKPEINDIHNNQSVIICHGMPSYKNNARDSDTNRVEEISYIDLAEWFALEGITTIIFNFRGTGESGGNFHYMGWVQDLNAVIDWLLAGNYVHPDKICLLGSSLGAAVAIYVTAHRKEIAGIVSFASPAIMSVMENPEHSLNRYRRMGIIRDYEFPVSLQDWAAEPQELDPSKWVGLVHPRPLLLLHGTEDTVVDPIALQILQDCSGTETQSRLIPGVKHRFRSEPEVMQISIEWLKNLFI
tara:strand:+ start:2593 stop:3390 length:798 start_codon:yes stop_codon:yes gene_type:complete